MLVPEFFAALKELGSAFHAGRASSGAAAKIEEELKKAEKPAQWGNLAFPKQPVALELKKVRFQYGPKTFQLQDISTYIPPLGQVAIVGKSGSGKTTLLHLLAGLLDAESGEIVVDGRVRSDYNEQEWFNQLSYITQHPYIFAGTIYENIAFGMSASQDEVKEAARKAGISDLIDSLKDGYDTVIGEGGRGLSGGEKQRIALARALLKKPSLILFDEPTTGLDLFTEKLLNESIQELRKSSTVITVAHRLQTIKNANQILFLEQGKLLGQGTHEQLLHSVAAYRDIFLKQREGEQQ